MAQTNYINFADYLDINQDEIRRMEEAMRAEEQRRLAGAVNATNAAGQSATEAAYWGEGVNGLMDYNEYTGAMNKQDAARRWQDALKTDKGQQELLTKLYGGQASALEAGLLFGSQEGGQKTKLGEYMGVTSEDFDRVNEQNLARFAAAKSDYEKELLKKSTLEDEQKRAVDAWMQARREAARSAMENQLKMEKLYNPEGKDRMGWGDYNQYMAWLSGNPTGWDAANEEKYMQRALGKYGREFSDWSEYVAGKRPGQGPAYTGRLSKKKSDWQREWGDYENEQQMRDYDRYNYGGGYY